MLADELALVDGELDGQDVLAWDAARKEGVIATDALGTRPVFLATHGGTLYFASELCLLLDLLPSRPAVDRDAVLRYLAGGRLPRGGTLYSGVRRLPGGTRIVLRKGVWTEETSWEPTYAEPLPLSRPEAVEELRRAIGAAVATRLPGDGRAGVLVSGGLDSASAAAAAAPAARAAGLDLRLYSASFPEREELDESRWARRLAESLDLPLASRPTAVGAMLPAGLAFLERWSVPCLSPNVGWQLGLLEQAHADGTGLLLDGQGGDELFGTELHLPGDALRRGRVRRALELVRAMPGLGPNPDRRVVRTLLWEYGVKAALPAAAHRRARRLRGSTRYAPPWFTADGARRLVAASSQWDWKRGRGPIWWEHLADLLTAQRERAGAHDFLRRKHTLAGTEGAHPFLDDRSLIELVLRLPPELSYGTDLERPLLREAMSGLLADDLRLRADKPYFNAFFRDCLSDADWPLLTRLLTAPDAELRAFVDLQAVRTQLLELPRERRGGSWAWSVWRLATVEAWLRREADREFVPGLLLQSAASR